MVRWTPRRRPGRLPLVEYARTEAVFSVTAGTKARVPVFADARVTEVAVDVLRAHVEKTKVVVYAYCFMPDHVHLVLRPSRTCDVVTFVGQFKNLCQRAAWQLGVTGAFWQSSFHDHALRFSDQLETFVGYVLNNPVRGGLVQRWQEYPFAGSLAFTAEQLATDREFTGAFLAGGKPPHHSGGGCTVAQVDGVTGETPHHSGGVTRENATGRL